MDDAKTQLAEKLKSANNILVTVSRDPSVDQLSALIGLTLLLNKQGKHAAAVFSGSVPSTIEFLQPEETIEKTTDSLRDFIIALDKNKADKLRYKVEDNVVRIFITPYKTSITKADFDFSQGDFNVDLVVALGVRQQEDLDEAITAHGRILHDAVVASINVVAEGGLGTITWHVPQASSLSELVTDLSQGMAGNLLDEQISTALLTGIVSETDRFRNEKTSPQTMSMSAALMTAGANQQLVASKLEESQAAGGQIKDDGAHHGAIEIDHKEPGAEDLDSQPADLPEVPEMPAMPEAPAMPEPPEVPIIPPDTPDSQPPAGMSSGPKMITEPPTMGGVLTANSSQPVLEPSTDPFSLPNAEQPQLLDRKPVEPPTPSDIPNPLINKPLIKEDGTLTQLEEAVDSPHVPPENLNTARNEVDRALNNSSAPEPEVPTPIQGLNAQPLGGTDLHPPSDPNAPPPVPPPIPFQFGNPSPPQ